MLEQQAREHVNNAYDRIDALAEALIPLEQDVQEIRDKVIGVEDQVASFSAASVQSRLRDIEEHQRIISSEISALQAPSPMPRSELMLI